MLKHVLWKSLALALLALGCAAGAEAATVNKVAAVVNGQMISEYDVHNAARPEMLKAGVSSTAPAQKEQRDAIYKRVLDGMILDILLAQEAEKQKITVSESEVDTEIARVMRESKLPKEAFEKQLQKEGLTPAVLRERVRKTLLRQKIMGMMVARKVVVTPEEVRAYYESHKSEMHTPRVARIGLLVYHPQAPHKAFAQAIKDGKLSFEEACKRASIAPNREKGGEMEPVDMTRLNPEWRARLKGMKAGQVSGLFTLQGRQAQIKLLAEPTGGEPLDLKGATPMVENILRAPRMEARFKEYSEQLRKKAMIDIRM